MPGLPDKAAGRDHMGTRTNQGSCIDYNTEKPYLHHLLGVPRAPISDYELTLVEASMFRLTGGFPFHVFGLLSYDQQAICNGSNSKNLSYV